jgi:hypothetical protein
MTSFFYQKEAAKHRKWLRKTKGLRAHLAELAREQAEEKDYSAFKAQFPTAQSFLDHMRNKRGCGPTPPKI